MKDATPTSNLLTKACLLALMLPATSYAQTHYDWTMSDDVAHWGSWYSNSVANPDPPSEKAGSYTRDLVHWSGPFAWKSWSHIGSGEGPYDGRSGLLWNPRSTGIMTRTDANAIFDLSDVGSSATIRTAYHYHAFYPETEGHAHLYQFGLTNNSSYLGKAGNESLIIAADFQNQDFTAGTTSIDLDLLDHTGIDTTGDGNWTPNPLLEIASGLELSSWNVPGDNTSSRPGKSHAIELTYTNIGNGKLQISVDIRDLYISGRTASDTVTSTNQVVQESYIVDHKFSDLSALRPGFGAAFNDSDIPSSGAAFDWEDAYAIPEPSSASLLGLGITGFLLRRKRK